MATSRVRNYAKKNEKTVNEWRDKVLHLHILRELNIVHRDESEIPLISMSDVVNTANQYRIGVDVLNEHFGLASGRSKTSVYGHKSYTLDVRTKVFQAMTEGMAFKPSLDIANKEHTSEGDIYTPLKQLNLPNLVYVFENQDEYVFIYGSNKRTHGSYELSVLDRMLEDEADNLSFRNSIDRYYVRKAGQVSWGVFGESAPDLDNFEAEYGAPDTYMSYNFVGVHNALLPNGIEDLNSKKMAELVKMAEIQTEILNRTLEQLKGLRDSILEAEALGDFPDLYYKQMIAHFTQAVPLLINDKDEKVQEMARRLAKKHYY